MKQICAFLLVFTLLAGCSSVSEEDLVGSYMGRFELADSDFEALTEQEQQARRDQAEQFTISIVLREDDTFTLYTSGAEGDGTWELLDGEVVLTNSEDSSLSGYDGQILVIKDGGSTLVGKDPSGESETLMIFSKM